jgi:DNA-binding Lrp family transcriptional regulator
MREEVFSERRLAETISVFDFPLKTASRRRRAITPRQTSIFVDLEQPEVSLKETDLMILRELTIDGNQSQANLARKLKMPVSTLGFRINQLREKQVIVGYHLLPGVETLQGYELSFRVHRIRLRQVGTRARAQLCEFCTKDPDVHGLTHCVGDIDAEICSAGASLSDERAFDGRLKGSLGDLISSISVLRVVSHRKVNGYPAS